jgi:hypothetical protein
MQLVLPLRLLAALASSLVAFVVCAAVLVNGIPLGGAVALVPFVLALLVLVARRPGLALTVASAAANILFAVFVGLFAAVGLSDFVQSNALVFVVWLVLVGLPALNVLATVFWYQRAARSNSSSKPTPLRGAA